MIDRGCPDGWRARALRRRRHRASRPVSSVLARLVPASVVAVLASVASACAEPLPVVEFAPGVFVHQGRHEEANESNRGAIANVGFVVGNRAVAVIDSGGSAEQGRRLRQAIRHETDLPIEYVVNTHVHPDHLFGNAAFRQDGAAFVGHARLPRAVAARGRYYLRRLGEALGAAAEGSEAIPPTVTVDDRLTLDLGGRTLELTAHPTAHTDSDLSVLDRGSGTLWTGDLLFVGRVPVVDGSLTGWLDVIATLRRLDVRRVVPGHGAPSGDWPGALDAQERYLRVLLDETRAAIATGETIERAVASVGRSERGRWKLFDAYHPRNVVTAFTELEWE